MAARLVAAAEPDPGGVVEKMDDGILVRLIVRDVNVDRVRSQLAQVVGLLLSASETILARHREDDDPRIPRSAGEIHESLHQRLRLRAATHYQQRALRSVPALDCRGPFRRARGACDDQRDASQSRGSHRSA